MIANRALPAIADPNQEIPSGVSARLDRIQIALDALRHEEHRLGRLGFELPLARCREERRFWEFMSGVFTVASLEDGRDAARLADRIR